MKNEQIIFEPGDILCFYGNEYEVIQGNPNGEPEIIAMQGIHETRFWVFPRKGVSKHEKINNSDPDPNSDFGFWVWGPTR